jgi:hypothetical protein
MEYWVGLMSGKCRPLAQLLQESSVEMKTGPCVSVDLSHLYLVLEASLLWLDLGPQGDTCLCQSNTHWVAFTSAVPRCYVLSTGTLFLTTPLSSII